MEQIAKEGFDVNKAASKVNGRPVGRAWDFDGLLDLNAGSIKGAALTLSIRVPAMPQVMFMTSNPAVADA